MPYCGLGLSRLYFLLSTNNAGQFLNDAPVPGNLSIIFLLSLRNWNKTETISFAPLSYIIIDVYKQKSFSISAWDEFCWSQSIWVVTWYSIPYSMQVNCKYCIYRHLSPTTQSLQFSIYCTQHTFHFDIIMTISNVQCVVSIEFLFSKYCAHFNGMFSFWSIVYRTTGFLTNNHLCLFFPSLHFSPFAINISLLLLVSNAVGTFCICDGQ